MPNEVKLLPCPFCEGEVEAIHAKRDLIWLEHLDHNRCSVFNDGVWTTTAALNTRPTTVVTDEVVELREALEPFARIGDNFSIPGGWADTDRVELSHGFRVLDKVPVAAFRNARAALASMPTVVTGEQPESVGDHALPPSGLSRDASQAKPAAAIARKES